MKSPVVLSEKVNFDEDSARKPQVARAALSLVLKISGND